MTKLGPAARILVPVTDKSKTFQCFLKAKTMKLKDASDGLLEGNRLTLLLRGAEKCPQTRRCGCLEGWSFAFRHRQHLKSQLAVNLGNRGHRLI